MLRCWIAAILILVSTRCLPVNGQEATQDERPKVVLSDEAKAIHDSCILVDGHNDLPWTVRARSNSSFRECDISKPQPQMHTDIPRLRKGGLKAQFWSVFVPASTDLTGNSLLQTLEQIDLVHKMVERYPDHFAMASTADDIERIVGEGQRKANETRGQDDAEVITQYAAAIEETGDFYTFVRTLEAYENSITEDTRMILTTENDFLRLLKTLPTEE